MEMHRIDPTTPSKSVPDPAADGFTSPDLLTPLPPRFTDIPTPSFGTTRREQTGTEVAAPTVLMWNPKSFLRKTSVPLHTDTGTNRIGSHF